MDYGEKMKLSLQYVNEDCTMLMSLRDDEMMSEWQPVVLMMTMITMLTKVL